MSLLCTPVLILVAICIRFTLEVPLIAIENSAFASTVSIPKLNHPVFNPLPEANLPVVSLHNPPIIQSQVPQPVIQDKSSIAGWSTLTSEVVPDVVQSFALQFIQGIECDPKLKEAFEIRRLTGDEAGNIYYDIFFQLHSDVHSTAPDFSAQMVSEAVKLNFDFVTTESLIKIYAYSMGKQMFFQGLLTSEKVPELSQKYLEKMRENICSVVYSTPETDIRSITKGFVAFLTSLGFHTQNNADIVVAHFTNEWYNLRK